MFIRKRDLLYDSRASLSSPRIFEASIEEVHRQISAHDARELLEADSVKETLSGTTDDDILQLLRDNFGTGASSVSNFCFTAALLFL